MAISLYEIDKLIEKLLLTEEEVFTDESTGEVIRDVYAALDELELEQKDKWENIAKFIKNLNAEMDALKKEEEVLKARRQTKSNTVERLKNYLTQSMQASGSTKFETSAVVVSFRKSESIEVKDETLLASEFKKVVEEIKVDKTAIKQAIKSGVAVAGAELVEKQNLQIK